MILQPLPLLVSERKFAINKQTDNWANIHVHGHTKPRFSLTFSEGLIIRLGLVAKIGVVGGALAMPLCVGVTALFFALFSTVSQLGSTLGCWGCGCSGIGVRWTRFLLILLVGVSIR